MRGVPEGIRTMSERTKIRLLIAAVVVLLGIAGWRGFHTLHGTAEPMVSPDFQRLTPQAQQQLLDQAERDRRAMGKRPERQLPEDRAGSRPTPQ
jgi:hypothetical protein